MLIRLCSYLTEAENSLVSAVIAFLRFFRGQICYFSSSGRPIRPSTADAAAMAGLER